MLRPRRNAAAIGTKQAKQEPESLEAPGDEVGESADDSFQEGNAEEKTCEGESLNVADGIEGDGEADVEIVGAEGGSEGKVGDQDLADINSEIQEANFEEEKEKDTAHTAENTEEMDKKEKDAACTEEKTQTVDQKDDKGSKQAEKASNSKGGPGKKDGILETPERRRFIDRKIARCVQEMSIPPFEVKDMRSRWKWSIRVSPVACQDIATSDLMNMQNVKAAYYHLSQERIGEGQMELCAQYTSDAMLVMMRILRAPFVNRTVTIEVIKRNTHRWDQKVKEGDNDAESSANGTAEAKGENEEAAMEEEQRREEEEQEGEDMEQESTPASYVFEHVGERVIFVVNLNKVQGIHLITGKGKGKGDLTRRCVHVSNFPGKCASPNMLKIMFPFAHSVFWKRSNVPKPGRRHMFIEMLERGSCFAVLRAYLAVQDNGQNVKLSMDPEDMTLLKKEKTVVKKVTEVAEKNMDETGESKKEAEKDAEEKTEEKTEEEKMEVEDNEKAGEKTEEESEEMDKNVTEGKNESPRDKSKYRKRPLFTKETKKARKQESKKRKRDLLNAMHYEWNAKRLREDSVPLFDVPRRRRMDMPAAKSLVPPQPVFQLQNKIASMVQVQNQLEQTINTQLEFIQLSEAAARRQKEQQRMRDMIRMRQELAMGSRNEGGGRRGFEGVGGMSSRSFIEDLRVGSPGERAGGICDFQRGPSFSDEPQRQGDGFGQLFSMQSIGGAGSNFKQGKQKKRGKKKSNQTGSVGGSGGGGMTASGASSGGNSTGFQSFAGGKKSFVGGNQGYGLGNQSYSGGNQAFDGSGQGYGGGYQSLVGRKQSRDGNNQSFRGSNQAFDGSGQGYGGGNQSFRGGNQSFADRNQGFGRSNLGFGWSNQGYGGSNQGFGGGQRFY